MNVLPVLDPLHLGLHIATRHLVVSGDYTGFFVRTTSALNQ